MKNFLPERLRELRGALSQSEFALKIGVKQTSYSSWERGVKDPASQTIVLIASTFGVSADWLLGLPERTGGGTVTVNAPVTGAVACVNSTATVGGDCSRCQLMIEHIRQITGRG